MKGHTNNNLRKMQQAAWKANRGRPRSPEVKAKISATRREKSRKSGRVISSVFDVPLCLKENHWCFFECGKKIYHARAVYEKYYGEIPKGYIIHHIDGDGLNDDPQNLTCLSRGEHYYLHRYWDIVNHWEGKIVDGKDILTKYKQLRNIK